MTNHATTTTTQAQAPTYLFPTTFTALNYYRQKQNNAHKPNYQHKHYVTHDHLDVICHDHRIDIR